MRIHRRWIALSRWSGQFDPRPLLRRGPLHQLSDFSALPPKLARSLDDASGEVEVEVEYRRIGDPGYPRGLLDLDDPPAVLWGRGNWGLLDGPAIAVVGSRSCTGYGRSVASRIGAAAARDEVVIVSGAARGIDRAAHTAALDSGGPTIAVLGQGLETRGGGVVGEFLDRLAQEALLLSELPPSHPPTRFTFPRRNRIIAALSSATVVVEAARRSGALHTANAALRLGRRLFAVPGPIDVAASVGCNRLLAQGAEVVTAVEDVLKPVRAESSGPTRLLEALVEPRSLAELASTMGQRPRELLATLVALELTGGVRRLADQRYVRV